MKDAGRISLKKYRPGLKPANAPLHVLGIAWPVLDTKYAWLTAAAEVMLNAVHRA